MQFITYVKYTTFNNNSSRSPSYTIVTLDKREQIRVSQYNPSIQDELKLCKTQQL